jgi:signal transduction histidine kinase
LSELQFRISAGLKNIIGRELITDDFIAVFELVKNAYDAYATRVDIIFEEDKIIIRDNGRGMSLDDLKNKWLFVAYSAKRHGEEYSGPLFEASQYDEADKQRSYRDDIKSKRPFAGAKGIGRFSCDRLGDHLTLKTKKSVSGSTWECLEINWTDFEENPRDEFIDIPVSHKTLTKGEEPPIKYGTELTISNLNSTWDYKHKLDLRTSLEKLIDPTRSNDDFEIIMHSNGFCPYFKDSSSELDGPIRNFIFETLNLKTTYMKVVLESGTLTSTLTDRGKLVYHISESSDLDYLKTCIVNLHFLNQAAKINFTKKMGLQTVHFGTIFVFKNGFRIYPIGNKSDDFFGLDRLKQQGHARYLGTREIICRVEIQDNDNVFRETSSRDGGFAAHPGVEELKAWFREKCTGRLARYVRISYGLKQIIDGEIKNLVDDREDTSLIENDQKALHEIAEIISRLASNKNITIHKVGKNFLDLIRTKVDDAQPKLFKDLEKIAKSINDIDYLEKIKKEEAKYHKAIKEKDEAIANAAKAEERAARARKRREIEEKARREAEQREQEARRRAKQAELARKEAKLREEEAQAKARQAELDRQAAELKAREEQIKAEEMAKKKEKAEIEAQKASEESVKLAEGNEEKERRILFYKSITQPNQKLLLAFCHEIILCSSNIKNYLDEVTYHQTNNSDNDSFDLDSMLAKIALENQKIDQLSKFITKANFKMDSTPIKENILDYIDQYISSTYEKSRTKVTFRNECNDSFYLRFRPIEISILIDNIVNNSTKAKAKKLEVSAALSGKNLLLSFEDNGIGLNGNVLDPDQIFELGFTTTSGSGIGLYHVKEIINRLNGTLQVLDMEDKGGFCLQISIPEI